MPRSKPKSRKKAKSKTPSGKITLSIQEKVAQRRQAKKMWRKIVTLAGICLSIALAIGLPTGILIDPKLGLVIGVGLPSFFISYNYPRLALWFFLIYMPFGGTVVYWIGGGNAIFQLAKDVFYIPALLALVFECLRKKRPILVPKQLLPTFAILLAYCLIVLFVVNGYQQILPYCSDLTVRFIPNPAGGLPIRVPCKGGIPFVQGILGLKILLGYVPLIFCAYYLIEDKKKLFFFGRLMVVLAIVCCCLGLFQYWLLDTGRCQGTRGRVGADLFTTTLQAKCLVGGSLLFSPSQGVIRLPGTFVSPWHWAWFLVSSSALTFTTAFSDPSRFWRFSGIVGMALVIINAIICGQRLALALVPAVILTLLLLTGQIVNLKKFLPIGIGLALILGIVVINNPDIVQARVDSLIQRWNTAPPQAFILKQLTWAAYNQKGFLGQGLGTGTNSTRAFGDVALIETFHSKLLFEISFLGLFLFLIFLTHITILSFQSYRSLKDSNLRSFGSCFWVFILIISFFPYWYPLDTDPVAVYYWFLAGIVFKLPVLEKQEQRQLRASQDNKSKRKSKRKKIKSRAA